MRVGSLYLLMKNSRKFILGTLNTSVNTSLRKSFWLSGCLSNFQNKFRIFSIEGHLFNNKTRHLQCFGGKFACLDKSLKRNLQINARFDSCKTEIYLNTQIETHKTACLAVHIQLDIKKAYFIINKCTNSALP